MFARPLLDGFSSCADIVGVFDVNPLRMKAFKEISGLDCPSFNDFDQMLAETRPDCAIITTVDRFHHHYTVKCLDSGLDVISEKPMAIDAEGCNAILEAEKRTGHKVIVTFNARFIPYMAAIRRAVKESAVGRVLNVDFEYMLDTVHGADYFRRWHRRKENSGGLLVHKATHHFDLVNWWIDAEPVEVMAYGARNYYGPVRQERGDRCRTCDYSDTCELYVDIEKNPRFKKMYLECEEVDGYHRDACVFSPEINIEDTMSVNVRYAGGEMMSYSLIAHSAYEGWKLCINGTAGRLEASEYYTGELRDRPCTSFDVFDRMGQKTSYSILKNHADGHGGGDTKLRRLIFQGGVEDTLCQQADSFAGALSVLIGAAANKSIAEHRNILINDLVPLDKYRPSNAG
jgi:predicted dehydrogenase